MSFPPIHRVVTGHDADGKAIIASSGPLPTVVEITAIPGTVFHEVWSTAATPAPVNNGPDPTLGPLMLPPPRHGTRIRFGEGRSVTVTEPIDAVLDSLNQALRPHE